MLCASSTSANGADFQADHEGRSECRRCVLTTADANARGQRPLRPDRNEDALVPVIPKILTADVNEEDHP